MSLILDALNRSQRDLENRDSVPGLETIHPVEAMSSPSKLAIGIGLTIICLAVVTAIWVFTPIGDSVVHEENEATLAPVPARSASPELQAGTQLIDQSPAAVKPSVPDAPVNEYSAPKSSLATAVVETADNSAVAALYQTSKQLQQPDTLSEKPALDVGRAVQETETIDIEDVLSRVKAGLENTQLEEHAAPFIADLSQQMKDSIPTIFYSVHDYSSVASRSSAVLNGKRVTVGQSVGGGLRVDEILADSIVLTFGGTQFRLKALNSWVNL